jgi:acetoin utilization protein AcuB
MNVRDVMRRAATIHPAETVRNAIQLARTRGVRHLVIVENGKICGIVADRDVKEAVARAAAREELGEPSLLTRLPVEAIMTRDVITIHPAEPVQMAARRMLDHQISALPVVENEQLVGIVAESDLLGIVAGAMVPDRAGSGRERLDQPSGRL